MTIQDDTADIIATMDKCKIMSRVGTGLDAINIPAATAKGIWVANVSDYSADEVSTHAITLLLIHSRSMLSMFQSVQEGTWLDQNKIGPAQRLQGQTLGSLGYGRIGQAMAAKGQGIGLDVTVYDPYVMTAALETMGVRAVDLETLLRTANFVSLHVPLTDTTRHIINTQTLAWMKPTALPINTARGPLIDETTLVEAVRANKIAGAAIDVFPIEPPPADHPFLHEKRIMVTPHAAC